MATHAEHAHGHRRVQRTWDLTPQQVVTDGLQRIRAAGSSYRLALIISAILGVIGVIALIIRPIIGDGWGDRQAWTYVAATFGFLMSTVGSAPCFSVAMRLTRGHWRRPVNRLAELWGAGLIVPFILLVLLIFVLPNTEGRQTLWFGWWAAPYLWDIVMMLALTICGYGFLYVASLPDMAIARDQVERDRPGRFTRMARGFRGTVYQWQIIDRGVAYLGALYILLYVGTMTVMASELILALLPGDNSAIFPAAYTVAGLESGIAVTIIAMAVFRRWGGAGEYLESEQFFAASKLMLALGLLWFYFHWTEFVIWWYGRTPRELSLLKVLYFEPYFWLFVIAFACMFLAPLFVLVWTRIRMGIAGPTVAACLVVVGQAVDQVRLMSASFSIPNIYQKELSIIPNAYIPGVFDILLYVGLAGGAFALVLLALKVVAYPSIWEVTAGLWLRARKQYYKTEVTLIGKPN